MKSKTEERYFLDLKTQKILKTGGKSKYVHIMSDGCIKKRYDSSKDDHQDHFEREIKILKHLHHWERSPCILWINWKKKTIYMTYCGPPPIPSRSYKAELGKLMEELRRDWRLYRITLDGTVTDHIDSRNLCIDEKDQSLNIIDFGSPLWILKDTQE